MEQNRPKYEDLHQAADGEIELADNETLTTAVKSTFQKAADGGVDDFLPKYIKSGRFSKGCLSNSWEFFYYIKRDILDENSESLESLWRVFQRVPQSSFGLSQSLRSFKCERL